MFLIAGGFFLAGLVIMLVSLFIAKDKAFKNGGELSKLIIRTGIGLVIFCTVISAGILFLLPNYYVWQQNKEGEAELAKAEQNRQIAIQEAKAKEESAKSLANA